MKQRTIVNLVAEGWEPCWNKAVRRLHKLTNSRKTGLQRRSLRYNSCSSRVPASAEDALAGTADLELIAIWRGIEAHGKWDVFNKSVFPRSGKLP